MTDPSTPSAEDLSGSIVVVGGGGHACAILDVLDGINRWEVLGLLDPALEPSTERYGVRVLGGDEALKPLVDRGCNVAIGVGQVNTSSPRHALFQRLREMGASLPAIVSARAYVSPRATLGAAVQVLHGAVVNADASIGANTIVNSRALVEHEAVIGPDCHLSTGAIVNGRTSVGPRSFVGSGAVVLHSLELSSDITVGAGAVVTRPLTSPGTYVGVPARPLP
jgi:sugar O-acyltransferase (sialic acid O-acetyltransferase NeuD family)